VKAFNVCNLRSPKGAPMANTAAAAPEEQHFVLSHLSPSLAQRRLAFAVVLALLVAFVITAGPLSTIQLGRIGAFVPAYATAIFVTDLLTAVLLFAQFSILRSRALLAIASGYLYTALIVIPWMLTFPDVFTPGGLLGAGLQTTNWLYTLWHAGFPFFVIAYALLKDADPAKGLWQGPPGAAILSSLAATGFIVCAVTFLVTAENDHAADDVVRASDGLGRPLEVFGRNAAHRLLGRIPWNQIGPKPAEPPNFVRLIEVELPATIIGYVPGKTLNAGVPAAYHTGYFDLKAIGFDTKALETKVEREKRQDFCLSFFARLIAGSATKAGLTRLTLKIRRDRAVPDEPNSWLELPIGNPENREIFGVYLDLPFGAARRVESVSYRLLSADGSLGALTSKDYTAKPLLLDALTEGLVVRISGLSVGGTEHEGWLEMSMLGSHNPALAKDHNLAPFEFDWLFTGKEQDPETAISETGLRIMVEAQARIISLSLRGCA
jgi:hypothetical protein